MSSIIGNIFSNAAETSADQTIAFNSSAATMVSAQAYLSAALSATTPEVRRLFADYSNQSLIANEAVMSLMMKRGWTNPYATPVQQLQNSVQQSQSLVGSQH